MFPEQDFVIWKENGDFPRWLPPDMKEFDGTQFQHLFLGMTFHHLKKYKHAIHHLRKAVEKDEDVMACCTEFGVFHRICRKMYNENLFDVIDDDEKLLEILHAI